MSRQPDEMRNPYTPPSATAMEPAPTALGSSKISQGRIIVLVLIWATIGLSALIITLYVSTVGLQTLPARLVRFGLTVGLMVCLYRGLVWARVLVVILMGPTCLVMAAMALAMGSEQSVILRGILMIGAFVHGSTTTALLFSSSVREFLNSQLE